MIDPLDVLMDRITDTKSFEAEVRRVGLTARSLTEAKTMLDNVAWSLHQREVELKRKLEALVDERKAAEAAAKKKSADSNKKQKR